MLERLNKKKIIVRFYVTNYTNDQVLNITIGELELFNKIILQLAAVFVKKKVIKTIHCSQA